MFEFISPVILTDDKPVIQEYVVSPQELLRWNTPMNEIAEMHLQSMSDEELDNDWRLDDFFGTIAVINLPQATQRLAKVTQELHAIGIWNFTIFTGIDGRKVVDQTIWRKFHSNRDRINSKTEEGQRALDRLHQGEAGCYLSHYYLIKSIKETFDRAMLELNEAYASKDTMKIHEAEQKARKYSRLLILEDDAGFGIVNKDKVTVTKTGVGKYLRKALSQLPKKWDILYLVVQAKQKSAKVAQNIRRLKESWSFVAYAINYTMYESLVNYLKKIEDPKVTSILPVDSEVSKIHHVYHVYALYPSVVYHEKGDSQISDKPLPILWQGQPVTKDQKFVPFKS